MAFCNQTAEMHAFSGIRSGDTGSYLSCLNLWRPANGAVVPVADAAKYCVVLGSGDVRPPPVLGLCVPAHCPVSAVVDYVASAAASAFVTDPFNTSVAHGAVSAYCSDDAVDDSSRRLGIGMLVVLVLLLALAAICTAYDYAYGITLSLRRQRERLSTALMSRRAMLAAQQRQLALQQRHMAQQQALLAAAMAADGGNTVGASVSQGHGGASSHNLLRRHNSGHRLLLSPPEAAVVASVGDGTAAPLLSSPIGGGAAAVVSVEGGVDIPIGVGVGVVPAYASPQPPSYYRHADNENSPLLTSAVSGGGRKGSAPPRRFSTKGQQQQQGHGHHRNHKAAKDVVSDSEFTTTNDTASCPASSAFSSHVTSTRAACYEATASSPQTEAPAPPLHEEREGPATEQQPPPHEDADEDADGQKHQHLRLAEGGSTLSSSGMALHRGDSAATLPHAEAGGGRMSNDSLYTPMDALCGDGRKAEGEGDEDTSAIPVAVSEGEDEGEEGATAQRAVGQQSKGKQQRTVASGSKRQNGNGEANSSIRGIFDAVAGMLSRRESPQTTPRASATTRRAKRVTIGDGLSQPLFREHSDSDDSAFTGSSSSSDYSSSSDSASESEEDAGNNADGTTAPATSSREERREERRRCRREEAAASASATGRGVVVASVGTSDGSDLAFATNLQGGAAGPTAAVYRRSRELRGLRRHPSSGSAPVSFSNLPASVGANNRRKQVDFSMAGTSSHGTGTTRHRSGSRRRGGGSRSRSHHSSGNNSVRLALSASAAAFSQRFTDYADAHFQHELDEGDLTRSEKVRTQIALHMERIIDDMPDVDSLVARVVRTWSLIAGFYRWRQQEGMGSVGSGEGAGGGHHASESKSVEIMRNGGANTSGGGGDARGSNLRLFNSIRTLCWVWIVLTDTFEYTTQIPTYEGGRAGEHQSNPIFAFIDRKACDTFAIGTFLMVSGFTVIHQLRDEDRRAAKDPVSIAKRKFAPLRSRVRASLQWYFGRIVRRWVRLAPLYIAIVFLSQATLLTPDAGAFWPAFLQNNALHGNCVKSFFYANLLFVNNLVPWAMKERCFPWTYYFALDFQFFAFAPIFHYVHRRTPTWLFYPLLAALCGGTIYARFDAQSTCDDLSLSDAEVSGGLVPLHSDFTTPWTMLIPYLLGGILCYFHAATIAKAQEIKMFGPQAMDLLRYSLRHTASPRDKAVYWLLERLNSKPFRVFCIWGGLFASLGTLFGAWYVNRDGPSVACGLRARMFAAFSVLPWCLGVFFCFLPMLFGYGGAMQRVLTHRLWMNSSKLIFAAYLAHPVVISIVCCIKDHPQTFDPLPFGYEVWGNVTLSILIALLFHLLIEQPFMHMAADVVEL